VIITVSKHKKSEEMKDKRHYDFMRLNSGSICCIYVIELIGLMNECNYEFWCSEISFLEGVQYYKIIFSELIGTFFRFFTNLTYVCYSLSRLSLIGQEHSVFVMKVSKETEMKKIIAILIVISVPLSVVKYFVYMINNINYKFEDFEFNKMMDQYPLKTFVYLSFNQHNLESKSNITNIFNCICDILNYPLFLFINLSI
jgi:hypothetical protein